MEESKLTCTQWSIMLALYANSLRDELGWCDARMISRWIGKGGTVDSHLRRSLAAMLNEGPGQTEPCLKCLVRGNGQRFYKLMPAARRNIANLFSYKISLG